LPVYLHLLVAYRPICCCWLDVVVDLVQLPLVGIWFGWLFIYFWFSCGLRCTFILPLFAVTHMARWIVNAVICWLPVLVVSCLYDFGFVYILPIVIPGLHTPRYPLPLVGLVGSIALLVALRPVVRWFGYLPFGYERCPGLGCCYCSWLCYPMQFPLLPLPGCLVAVGSHIVVSPGPGYCYYRYICPRLVVVPIWLDYSCAGLYAPVYILHTFTLRLDLPGCCTFTRCVTFVVAFICRLVGCSSVYTVALLPVDVYHYSCWLFVGLFPVIVGSYSSWFGSFPHIWLDTVVSCYLLVVWFGPDIVHTSSLHSQLFNPTFTHIYTFGLLGSRSRCYLPYPSLVGWFHTPQFAHLVLWTTVGLFTLVVSCYWFGCCCRLV